MKRKRVKTGKILKLRTRKNRKCLISVACLWAN